LVVLYWAGDTRKLSIRKVMTLDSLGACQGVSIQKGTVFLYGDREVGIVRSFNMQQDTLAYLHHEMRLTVNGKNVINHPTGIAWNGGKEIFMGNSVRLNKEGTKWKAYIYLIDWPGLQKTGTLDGNLLKTIDDDACIQGTRPEYVQINAKWYVATADYGNHGNEVRFYDAGRLRQAARTSEPGVLYKKFTCGPWVQNLFWMKESSTLVLIQNQTEGKRWRLSFVDLQASLTAGKEVDKQVIDLNTKADELEGFAFLESHRTAVAVTSSRKENVTLLDNTNTYE